MQNCLLHFPFNRRVIYVPLCAICVHICGCHTGRCDNITFRGNLWPWHIYCFNIRGILWSFCSNLILCLNLSIYKCFPIYKVRCLFVPLFGKTGMLVQCLELTSRKIFAVLSNLPNFLGRWVRHVRDLGSIPS